MFYIGLTHTGIIRRIVDGKVTYPNISFGSQNPDRLKEHGYVYVFRRETASEYMNGEYLAYKPARPLLAVLVSKTDFKYLIQKLEIPQGQ